MKKKKHGRRRRKKEEKGEKRGKNKEEKSGEEKKGKEEREEGKRGVFPLDLYNTPLLFLVKNNSQKYTTFSSKNCLPSNYYQVTLK